MDISVELFKLGETYQSEDMGVHATKMLSKYLDHILWDTCWINSNFQGAEARFQNRTDFPRLFCNTVVNAFDKERPAKRAQGILADFAFAARMHLFNNKAFVAFITDKVVPEFGNLVLTALLNGSVSGVFDNLAVFQQWRDWRMATPRAPPSQAEVPSPSPRVASGGGSAPPEPWHPGRGRDRGRGSGSGASPFGTATPK